MSTYKNILIGKTTIYPDWNIALNKIKKDHIIFCDFTNFENLKEIISNKNITYVLPLSQIDYEILLLHVFNLDNKIKILFPTKEIFNLLNNKNEFTQFMLNNYIENIPEVYYLNDQKLKNITYPAIYKPIFSTNASEMQIIYDNNDLIKLKKYNNIQKFIENEYEYGAFMLCIDGKIITQKIIRYKYNKYNIKKSNFPKNYEVIENLDTSIFTNIFEKLNYSGGANIDFKCDESNNIYIFEINPRFGGSAFTNNFIYELLCIPEIY